MALQESVILAGALAGGFVSGLTGFGTGLTVLAFWLLVVPPSVAAPLVVLCSIIAQLQTLPAIWRSIDWRRVAPFVVGGMVGIPLGTLLLVHAEPGEFKMVVGLLLLVYCSLMLRRPRAPARLPEGGWLSGMIGLGGGLLGGFAGLSGVLPSVWATVQRWSKDEARSVFQTFNLTILSVSVVSMAAQGLMTSGVGTLALYALPGTVLGAWLGRRLYARVSDDRFNRIILLVLLFAGVSLLLSALVGLF